MKIVLFWNKTVFNFRCLRSPEINSSRNGVQPSAASSYVGSIYLKVIIYNESVESSLNRINCIPLLFEIAMETIYTGLCSNLGRVPISVFYSWHFPF